MFVLGIFGIIQVLFLPGLIARKYLKFPGNIITHVCTVVAVSLIANYLLAFILTSVGLFFRTAVLITFFIEIAWLCYLYRTSILERNIADDLTRIWNSLRDAISGLFKAVDLNSNSKLKQTIQQIMMMIAFIAALVAIEWISRFFRNNLGSVFDTWDAVVSWNKWAVEWAGNRFPVATQDYPQLIPSNWSIIYLFLGTTDIQLFAKAIMPLYSLMMLLLVFGLGVQHREMGYFIAVILLRLIIKKFSGEYIASGYVDLPLAFFSLLSFILLYEAITFQGKEYNHRYYYLAILMASGAAITKQPGLYLLIGVILIGFFYPLGIHPLSHFKTQWRKYLPIVLIPLLVVVPWYAFKLSQFVIGLDNTHLFAPFIHTSSSNSTGNLFANIWPGLQSLGKYFYVFMFIIPSIFVIGKFWRLVGAVYTLPYIILWAGYASYDVRNLTIMFPIIAIIVGLGISRYLELILTLMDGIRLGKLKIWLLLSILLAGLVGLGIYFSDDKLQNQQIEMQKKLFSPSTNDQLYAFFETHPKGKILTSYPVDYLPDMEGMEIYFKYDNYQEFLAIIEDSEIMYLLYPSTTNDEISNYISEQVEAGNYEFVFENNDFIHYRFISILER